MQDSAILIADAHVKSRLWTNFPRIRGDSYEAMKQISKKAGPEGVVISCGDLFDSLRPSSADLDCVSKFLSNIKILLYVDGNHDNAIPSISPSLGTNYMHLTEDPFELFGFDFYGIDYCNNKDSLMESLSKVALSIKDRKKKKRPILIMHQSLDVFFMYHSITLQEIRDILGTPCDIFIGDIHTRKLIESPEGRCMSPGPLVPQDIGQAKHEQFATELIFDKARPAVEIKDIPMRVRKFCFIDSPDSLDSTIDRVLEESSTEGYPLAPVITVKVPTSYMLPRELSQRDDIIVLLDTASEVVKKEAVVKATASSLEEAVKAEAATSGGDTVEILTKLLIKLMHSEVPDEVLLELLEKWKVVMV